MLIMVNIFMGKNKSQNDLISHLFTVFVLHFLLSKMLILKVNVPILYFFYLVSKMPLFPFSKYPPLDDCRSRWLVAKGNGRQLFQNLHSDCRHDDGSNDIFIALFNK